MSKVLSAEPNEYIDKVAKELENIKEIKAPDWAHFVKTGVHKQRPPVRNDWWNVRAASILRKIYKMGPIGTSKLKTIYGGRKQRGYRPEHHADGSGSIIRKILQQLEAAKLVAKVETGVHKGRKVTKEGNALLKRLA